MNPLLKNVGALYIALCPILSIYSIGNFLNFYFIFGIILIPFFVKQKIQTKAKDEIILLVGIVLASLFSFLLNESEIWFSSSLFVNNGFGILIFFGIVVFITYSIDYKLFFKYALILALFVALASIYQRYQLITTGTFDPGQFILTNFQLSRELDTFTIRRPCSFFTEPAHLSIYLLPVYYGTLLSKEKLYSIILGLGILCSGSSTGFILMGLITIWHLISQHAKKEYILFSLSLFALVIYILQIYAPDILEGNLEKLSSTESESVRLLGPLKSLSYFNISQYIFGLSLNQLKNFQIFNHIPLAIYANYANAFIYSFICYGMLGFCLFVSYLYKKLRKSEGIYGFCFILIGIFASDQILFNSIFVYILSFVILSSGYHLRTFNVNMNI